MEKTNIILSVVIVLCIAGGVTAYGLTNPDNNILSSLTGFTPSDDSDSTGDDVNNDPNGGDVGESDSSPNSGGQSSGSGSGSSVSTSHMGMSSYQAKQIATDHIGEPGAYAGTPTWDESIQMWIVKVYDQDGNVVDGIGVDPLTGRTNRV